MTTQDVNSYMIKQLHCDAAIENDELVAYIGPEGEFIEPGVAEFMYRQSLLARRDELGKIAWSDDVSDDVKDALYELYTKPRLAELDQLLGESGAVNELNKEA